MYTSLAKLWGYTSLAAIVIIGTTNLNISLAGGDPNVKDKKVYQDLKPGGLFYIQTVNDSQALKEFLPEKSKEKSVEERLQGEERLQLQERSRSDSICGFCPRFIRESCSCLYLCLYLCFMYFVRSCGARCCARRRPKQQKRPQHGIARKTKKRPRTPRPAYACPPRSLAAGTCAAACHSSLRGLWTQMWL